MWNCGNPLDDLPCRYCTCEWCGYYNRGVPCLGCNSETESLFTYEPTSYSYNDSSNLINPPPQPQTYSSVKEEQNQPENIQELLLKLINDWQILNGIQLKQEEQAAKVSSQYCKPLIFYDDDDEESSIPLRDIIYELPLSVAITPDLPITDSLIMKDEHLNTIPEMESDEVIKSSIEDLVPIPCESEDTFESDSDGDLPSCDDFSPINVYEEKSVTFSNPLFDSNDNFTSSDEESLSDEDNIESKDSYVSNLDEPALLVTPLSDANEDECFDPGGEIDEIDVFLDMDISTDIKNGYHDSEGDIIYLESLLIDDTIPNLPPEVFLDHNPRSLKDELDKEDLMTEDKIFDPGIPEKFFSPTYVKLPFKDRHYFSLTYVIRIFLPYFTYLVESPFLLSSGSEDTIFDPDISAFYFSSLEPVASHRSETFMCFNVYLNILNESPMEIFSSTCFVPNIMMIWG
ncbi:hypothetical protein Tco_0934716 [Tanacetum coccineum]